jgi:aminopeptidase N
LFRRIRPEARETVYCTAIKYGGVREWDFAWQMALNVPSSQQREKLIAAMGCTREPWILIRYLSFILKTDSGIRKQDKDSVMASVSANPVGRHIAFRFIRDNFDHLIAT